MDYIRMDSSVTPSTTSSSSNLEKNSTPKEMKNSQLTGMLIIAAISCAFGSSFLLGYNLCCINLPADIIAQWFAESYQQIYGVPTSAKDMDTAWSLAVAILAIGAVFGASMAGPLADRFGRRGALLANNALALAAAAPMTLAKYTGIYWLIIVGRFVAGVNTGINGCLSPMYLTEIAPTYLRGSIGLLHHVFMVAGVVTSQIIGLPYLFGTAEKWPFIFGLTSIPSILQLVTLPFSPESPKYTIIAMGRKAQAEKDLKMLRGQNDVHAELEQIVAESEASSGQLPPNMLNMFRMPLLWPLMLGVSMNMSDQFSAINAVNFYSTKIFKDAGMQGQGPNFASIATNIASLLTCFMTVFLVERFGRRPLYLIGLIGMMVTSGLIAISILVSKSIPWCVYFTIPLMMLLVVMEAIGPGPVSRVVANELFPTNARANVNSIVVICNWGGTAIVGFVFPMLNELLHEYSFFVFTVSTVPFLAYAWKFLPETKNKSVGQIRDEMDRLRRNAKPVKQNFVLNAVNL